MTYTAGQKLRASEMSGYTCTSATRPTGHTGQIIYETDTGQTAIYTSGGTWKYLAPTGEVSTGAEYNATSAQTVATSSDTVIAFGTENVASSLVTRGTSGAGHTFTLNRAGLWQIGVTLRYNGVAANRETYIEIRESGYGIMAADSVVTNLNLATTMHCTVSKVFEATDVVFARTFQSSGGNLNTIETQGWTRINLNWIHA